MAGQTSGGAGRSWELRNLFAVFVVGYDFATLNSVDQLKGDEFVTLNTSGDLVTSQAAVKVVLKYVKLLRIILNSTREDIEAIVDFSRN